MPSILWTGRLSPELKLIVNLSNILAWITGNARDVISMKMRMKMGYNAELTDSVTKYDELGLSHYTKIAETLLEEIQLKNKELLDVGCGTGILSMLALAKGAKKTTCGDLSEYMLNQCRRKMAMQGYGDDRVEFKELDAESIPFNDDSFDITASSVVIGLVPNQEKVIREMARVTRSKGVVAIATHGPGYYSEAINAAFKVVPKRYVIGYRIEFWPRTEKEIQLMLQKAGLVGVKTHRINWQDEFNTGGELYDFFAVTSSSWWCAKFPTEKIVEIADNTRAYIDRKGIRQLTLDVIFGYGHKP